MTWLMDGQRPTSVTAVTQQIKPEIYPRVDDEATIILTYPKAQAILQASWNWPFDRKDMEVYGQTGYVITVRHDDVRVRLKGEEQEKLMPAKPVPAPSDDSYQSAEGGCFGRSAARRAFFSRNECYRGRDSRCRPALCGFRKNYSVGQRRELALNLLPFPAPAERESRLH